MKLYAQSGFQRGEKINEGLRRGAIDGFILSPKDDNPEQAAAQISEAKTQHPATERLLDPQLYVLTVATNENLREGKLPQYVFYPANKPRRRELLNEDTAASLVNDALDYQASLGLSTLIAPNVLVTGRLDSVWGAVSENMVSITGRACFERKNETRPILSTLALDSNCLSQRREIDDLLNEITGSRRQPDGFYLLVAFPDEELKYCLTSDLFANWMYLVYSLSQNGFEVVTGYSDYLTPFLGIAGADAGACGWFENLRKFSISRFTPEGGFKRQPLPRYSSPVLLNRILISELSRSGIIDSLSSDPSFIGEFADETPRAQDIALQHWTAVKNAIEKIVVSDDTETNIEAGFQSLQQAETTYTRLSNRLVSLDPKSDDGLIGTLSDGLGLFRRLIR